MASRRRGRRAAGRRPVDHRDGVQVQAVAREVQQAQQRERRRADDLRVAAARYRSRSPSARQADRSRFTRAITGTGAPAGRPNAVIADTYVKDARWSTRFTSPSRSRRPPVGTRRGDQVLEQDEVRGDRHRVQRDVQRGTRVARAAALQDPVEGHVDGHVRRGVREVRAARRRQVLQRRGRAAAPLARARAASAGPSVDPRDQVGHPVRLGGLLGQPHPRLRRARPGRRCRAGPPSRAPRPGVRTVTPRVDAVEPSASSVGHRSRVGQARLTPWRVYSPRAGSGTGASVSSSHSAPPPPSPAWPPAPGPAPPRARLSTRHRRRHLALVRGAHRQPAVAPARRSPPPVAPRRAGGTHGPASSRSSSSCTQWVVGSSPRPGRAALLSTIRRCHPSREPPGVLPRPPEGRARPCPSGSRTSQHVRPTTARRFAMLPADAGRSVRPESIPRQRAAGGGPRRRASTAASATSADALTDGSKKSGGVSAGAASAPRAGARQAGSPGARSTRPGRPSTVTSPGVGRHPPHERHEIVLRHHACTAYPSAIPSKRGRDLGLDLQHQRPAPVRRSERAGGPALVGSTAPLPHRRTSHDAVVGDDGDVCRPRRAGAARCGVAEVGPAQQGSGKAVDPPK